VEDVGEVEVVEVAGEGRVGGCGQGIVIFIRTRGRFVGGGEVEMNHRGFGFVVVAVVEFFVRFGNEVVIFVVVGVGVGVGLLLLPLPFFLRLLPTPPPLPPLSLLLFPGISAVHASLVGGFVADQPYPAPP